MSIPSKWNMEKKIGRWLIFRESDGVFVCEIQSEANAKRICQTHNSFDGLLEALKEGLEWIYPMTDTLVEEKERENVIKRVQQAIAQAEL